MITVTMKRINLYYNKQHKGFSVVKRNRGFTLVETLITVLVGSIGLLGLAKLNALGMQYNQSAYWRTQATYLAYDMADRMRANDTAVNAGDYNNPTATYTASCYTTTGCTSAELAKTDYYEWIAKVAELLPNGTGVVCETDNPDSGTSSAPDCHGNRVYAIKIWWTDEISSGVTASPSGPSGPSGPSATPQDEYFFYLNFQP